MLIAHVKTRDGGTAVYADPVESEPVVGKWYSGMSERGRGAVAQYQGWGEFTLGDGTVIDMTAYAHIQEH